MTAKATLECKKLLVRRCMRAVSLSVATQFLLLTIFVLSVNFHPLHPLNWIIKTLQLVCTFRTWFSIIPLIGAVLLYGVVLGKLHLAERHYYRTRYAWLVQNVAKKFIFLVAHILVGFLTAWLYTSYLHVDYTSSSYECYGQRCINSYYTFLISTGIFAGCYHFVKVHMRYDVFVEFPIVRQSSLLNLRSVLYSTFLKSLQTSFIPTLGFTLTYWIFGGFLNRMLADVFTFGIDDRLDGVFSFIKNIRLLFYALLLATQILSNMTLMQRFYSLLLSEDLPLIIAKKQIFANNEEITLAEALSVSKIHVVQCLAAKYLYQMSLKEKSMERLELFSLSEPGNHPVNWTQLCTQCLNILRTFTDELTSSVKQISSLKEAQVYTPSVTSNAKITAEKFLLRQYNEKHGIRSIVTPQTPNSAIKEYDHVQVGVSHVPNVCKRFNARCELFSRQLEASIQNFVRRIPGMVYFFTEPDGAKTLYLLDNCLCIIWVTQGLAGLCKASKREDRFGVVQNDLPEIIQALVDLNTELDKLTNITINGKKLNRNFDALKAALRNSLYMITNTFGDYMREILPDSFFEIRKLQDVLCYQE